MKKLDGLKPLPNPLVVIGLVAAFVAAIGFAGQLARVRAGVARRDMLVAALPDSGIITRFDRLGTNDVDEVIDRMTRVHR